MAIQGEYEPSQWDWVREQVERYEASGGREANTLRGGDDPIVVVTSRGAKSGKVRKHPVMRVERDGKYLAVASKGGDESNPAWYFNLVAHPDVELQDGPERLPFRARVLEGGERADWWEHAVATWPTYARYQEQTEREIPLFLLEPAR